MSQNIVDNPHDIRHVHPVVFIGVCVLEDESLRLGTEDVVDAGHDVRYIDLSIAIGITSQRFVVFICREENHVFG